LDQGEICVWDLHIGPGLLEVLGSEGQDIRRYPGARLFFLVGRVDRRFWAIIFCVCRTGLCSRYQKEGSWQRK
jgi:hypothetical protein